MYEFRVILENFRGLRYFYFRNYHVKFLREKQTRPLIHILETSIVTRAKHGEIKKLF